MGQRRRRITRHQRLRRKLASSYRQPRQLKRQRNADHLVVRHLIELYRSDGRLVPPRWAWDEVYGMQVLRPSDQLLITGL